MVNLEPKYPSNLVIGTQYIMKCWPIMYSFAMCHKAIKYLAKHISSHLWPNEHYKRKSNPISQLVITGTAARFLPNLCLSLGIFCKAIALRFTVIK